MNTVPVPNPGNHDNDSLEPISTWQLRRRRLVSAGSSSQSGGGGEWCGSVVIESSNCGSSGSTPRVTDAPGGHSDERGRGFRRFR